jgi:hypothetical protein
MTHLFHRLADRTLRQSRTVRPVTPPLFAAVSAESESTPSAPPRPPQWSDTALLSRRKTQQPRADDNPTEPGVTLAAPDPSTLTPTTRNNVVSPPTPPTPEQLTTAPDAAATDAPTSVARPIVPPPVTVEPTMTPAPMSEPVGPVLAARTQTPANTTVSTNTVEPPQAPSRLTLTPPVTRAAPVLNTTPRIQRVERTPPPAPTIEVTIGRIEVRTQAPSPPRRPRPQRQPALSLEAYAAERKAGRR